MTDVALQRPDVTLIGTGTGTGEGPPALLLHAGGERRQTWEPVAAALAQAGYCSLAYDQRGHGDSDPANADSLPSFAADVAAMIDTLDAAPVVVGCSLGGLAALLALDPQLEARVAGLILVDVVPDSPPQRTRARQPARSETGSTNALSTTSSVAPKPCAQSHADSSCRSGSYVAALTRRSQTTTHAACSNSCRTRRP